MDKVKDEVPWELKQKESTPRWEYQGKDQLFSKKHDKENDFCSLKNRPNTSHIPEILRRRVRKKEMEIKAKETNLAIDTFVTNTFNGLFTFATINTVC